MEATCHAYGQRSHSQLWDDNKFPCRSQYGATPEPPILAESRSERLLLISDSERKLEDIEIVDEEDLFYRLQELLNDIPIRELRKVFTSWIKRLVDVSKAVEAIYPSP
jgi:hypothetical protein